MSRKTKHYSERQRAVLYHEAHIKRASKNVDRHWWSVAEDFYIVREKQLYEELDLTSFSQWCEHIEVSPSHGWFLAEWFGLPNSVRSFLQKCGIAKAKLMIAHLPECEQDALEFIDAHTHMTWRDLQDEFYDKPIIKWVKVKCPHCSRDIELSKAAQVRSPQ